MLEELDAGQQHARVADDAAAGFEQQGLVAMAARIDARQQRGDQGLGLRRGLVAIGDAEPAAQVEVMQGDAIRGELIHQVEQPIHGIDIRRDFGDLRADVEIDADDVHMGALRRRLVQGARVGIGDAELVAFETGRDVGMRLGIDIRIDADRNRRALAQTRGHGVDAAEFIRRLDVEAQDARLQRLLDLGLGLADAREHDLARIAACGEHAREFAARHDVEAGTRLGERAQHAQIAVRLHGVTDQRSASLQPASVGGKRLQDRVARIDIGRRAVTCGDLGQRKAFGVQDAVVQSERVHRREFVDSDGATSGLGVAVGGGAAGRVTVGFCGAGGMTSGPRWPQAIRLPDRIKTSSARILPTSRSSLA